MKNTKVWIVLFFILLSINLLGAIFYFSFNKMAVINDKQIKIDKLNTEINKLDTEYLENAKQLKYLLGTLLENSKELKKYMSDYNNISDAVFEEKLRQKIVRLDIKIEELEKK
jgi:uncharacterized protein YpmS